MGQEFNKEKTFLEEVVNVLPHKIKTYISSGKLENDIKTISQKYNLSKDQENELKKECTYVLMGAESPTGMSLNLEKSLSEKENREEILTAATSILEPFIEDLAKIYIHHYEKMEKETLKKGAPAPPPTPPEGVNREDKAPEQTLKPLTYNKENSEKEKADAPSSPQRDNEEKSQTEKAKEDLIRTIEDTDRQNNDKEK
ncbi:MAG: hypothetical protein ACQEP6_02620 [Patescibacteria group bacterium]